MNSVRVNSVPTIPGAPKSAQGAPRTVAGTPKAILGSPKTDLGASRTALGATRTVQDCSGTSQNRTGSSHDSPGSSQNSPGSYQNSPGSSQDTPRSPSPRQSCPKIALRTCADRRHQIRHWANIKVVAVSSPKAHTYTHSTLTHQCFGWGLPELNCIDLNRLKHAKRAFPSNARCLQLRELRRSNFGIWHVLGLTAIVRKISQGKIRDTSGVP